MLKKRFILFLLLFAFLVVIFNFSLVSASLEGASKIRMLSLSIILSIFEITIAVFVFFTFFKSALGFSKKEQQLSLILNNLEYGLIVYNDLNEVLFLNPKAEKILGINFKDVASVRLSPESSLRNPKLNKLVGALFFSKLDSESEGEKKFSVLTRETTDGNKKLFFKTIKEDFLWHKTPDTKSIIDTAYRLRTPLSEIKWIVKTLLEDKNTTNQTDLIKCRDANENAIKLTNDLLDIYKKASEDEKSIKTQ